MTPEEKILAILIQSGDILEPQDRFLVALTTGLYMGINDRALAEKLVEALYERSSNTDSITRIQDLVILVTDTYHQIV